MESTVINLAEEKSYGVGETEAVKSGQDDTAEEMGVAGEMKQLVSQVNQVVCGGRAGALAILPVTKSTRITDQEVGGALYSDFVHLRLFLPDEIWKLVTEKLPKENLDDLEALANSSLFFRNLLASQRTIYLFEKVVNLVASTVWKQEGLEGFPVSDVLNCRAVCSHWNAVIDKLIPEKFQHFGEGSKNIQASSIARAFKSIINPSFATYRSSKKSIHNFLRHFGRSHPGNQSKGRDPLIWGNISLEVVAVDEDDDDYAKYQHYLQAIFTLLSKYGTYFHTCSLHISEFEDESKLVEWLSSIPNIKVLDLYFENSPERWWQDGFHNELNFPKWNHLETLVTDLPAPLFNQLIRQNSHVSTLVNGVYEVDYDFFTFPFPNLRNLKMGYCTINHVQKCRLAEGQWPLESLTLEFGNVFGGIDELFQLLHDMFGGTLAGLDLNMKEIERGEGPLWLACKECRLDLPKLRKISLAMHVSLMSLDFLLKMKHNLEEISVQVVYRFPLSQKATLTSGTIVQFMGFEEKMLESNIWAIFKKLKKVEVKADLKGKVSRCYTREDWMLNNEYY